MQIIQYVLMHTFQTSLTNFLYIYKCEPDDLKTSTCLPRYLLCQHLPLGGARSPLVSTPVRQAKTIIVA